jgi:hypothetical protein
VNAVQERSECNLWGERKEFEAGVEARFQSVRRAASQTAAKKAKASG